MESSIEGYREFDSLFFLKALVCVLLSPVLVAVFFAAALLCPIWMPAILVYGFLFDGTERKGKA